MLKNFIASIAGGLISTAALALGPVAGQGSWETDLLPRDLDHNGQVDAFYDRALGITWLANWNPADGQGIFGVGSFWYAGSRQWAKEFTLGSYSDWRLPTRAEYQHMYSVTLGNLVRCDNQLDTTCLATLNTGPLQNFKTWAYWTNETFPGGDLDGQAYPFEITPVGGGYYFKTADFFVTAVMIGDPLAVPEPGTALLAAAGVGIVYARRRRTRAA